VSADFDETAMNHNLSISIIPHHPAVQMPSCRQQFPLVTIAPGMGKNKIVGRVSRIPRPWNEVIHDAGASQRSRSRSIASIECPPASSSPASGLPAVFRT